jgi:hypothetical protein
MRVRTGSAACPSDHEFVNLILVGVAAAAGAAALGVMMVALLIHGWRWLTPSYWFGLALGAGMLGLWAVTVDVWRGLAFRRAYLDCCRH